MLFLNRVFELLKKKKRIDEDIISGPIGTSTDFRASEFTGQGRKKMNPKTTLFFYFLSKRRFDLAETWRGHPVGSPASLRAAKAYPCRGGSGRSSPLAP